jgi:CBS domain-containing protein
MKARDIMTRRVATATPDTPVVEIAKLLVDNDCGAIPILEDDASRKPLGVVTDRDIVTRVVAVSEDPEETTADDCMTTPCVTVGDDASFDEVCDAMEKARIRRLVVVDDQGACCGVIAQADIARQGSDKAGEVVQEVSQPTGAPSPQGGRTVRSIS